MKGILIGITKSGLNIHNPSIQETVPSVRYISTLSVWKSQSNFDMKRKHSGWKVSVTLRK